MRVLVNTILVAASITALAADALQDSPAAHPACEARPACEQANLGLPVSDRILFAERSEPPAAPAQSKTPTPADVPSNGTESSGAEGKAVDDKALDNKVGTEPPGSVALASLERAPSEGVVIPPALRSAFRSSTPIQRVSLSAPVLAPMAHTFFCLKYPAECKVRKVFFRGGPITLTAKRWDELVHVNSQINRAIIQQPNRAGLAAEKWLIAPKAGECHDYAVTKRHELIGLGWPERDLLLSEVVTSWGEHHLVLVVRTSEGDLVADSLTSQLRDWSRAPYRWVRVQSPDNPTLWSGIASTPVWVKANTLVHRES